MSAAAMLYLNGDLRVLAMWQPWGTLAVAPDPAHAGYPSKEHETRHWAPRGPTPIRVVIHAAKKCDGETLPFFGMLRCKDALERCGYYPGDPRPFVKASRQPPRGLKLVPLGCLIGVATIDYVRATEARQGDLMHRLVGEISEDDRAFGDYGPDRFAWHLTDVVALPRPLPFMGRQDALYPLDHIALANVRQQLRELAGVEDAADVRRRETAMFEQIIAEDSTRVIVGQAAE